MEGLGSPGSDLKQFLCGKFLHWFSYSLMNFDTNALTKLQATWKGKRTREGEYARAKAGATILCPYLASPQSVIEAVSNILHEKLVNSGPVLFFDLGCGEGNVLIGVAKEVGTASSIDATQPKKYAQACHFIGIDIDGTLCATARRRAVEAGVEDIVEIRQQDLASITTAEFTVTTATTESCVTSAAASLTHQQQQEGAMVAESAKVKDDASSPGTATYLPVPEIPSAPDLVVFVFLVPSCLEVLSKSLFSAFPAGTYLILYKFPLLENDGWQPVKTMVVDDALKKEELAKVFLYVC